ncbi:hypothetical protein Halru_2612 [Halovivax ruber XH-70]|uniref:Uncharacterized protein n=1 Tax=Halovivax ruber (strain DSM 18193 / JCM 13892 / XH-70) TaxID=797302 RepID=L0IG36_HALRX|nr:hypothetical protein [Halovivax ruber]AGB17191.1 hypothetical protein Halru_2612 [Halovivax ruber XH-70]
MTEHDTEPSRTRSHRDEHADPTDAETRPDTASGADGTTDGRHPRRVKDRDHTSPVEGPERTFDRYHEGRSAQTDGGRRPNDEADGDASEAPATDDDAPRRRVKDRDHTSPVDGHVRTFGRGSETTDRSK